MKNGNGRTKRLIAGGLVGLFGLTFAPSVAGAAISTTNFCANVPTGQSGFTDIAQTGVHQRNVECAKAANLVQGTTATTFGTGPLSRGQMATIIANMIDFADAQDAPGGATVPSLPTAAASQDRFTDDETSVHENNINRLAQAGVVAGTSATTFSPSANVSRGQMASFIAQALAFIRGAALPEGTDQFTDDETSVHEANLNRLGTADIIDGTGASSGRKATGNPGGEVSRPQTASFVIQGLAFIHAEGLILPVPPRAGSGVTSRPELTQAQLLETASSGVNIGTTVRFTFDEPMTPTAGGAPGSAPLFYVYNNAGLVDAGDAISSSSDFSSVVVRFAAVTTASGAQGLTLATVDLGGVIDFNGEVNPEGDAPLNNVGSTALPAGITNAPDILSFGNFRAAAGDNTLVDVTFDEAALDTGLAGQDIGLLYQQGVIDVPCTYDSGDGDTVLTYACPNGGDGEATNTIAAAAPIIARAYILPGRVRETPAAAETNALQVAEAANSGNTGAPDIVTVTFNLEATNGGANVDSALVTFDQNVVEPAGGSPNTLWTAYGLNPDDAGPPAGSVNPTDVVAVGPSSPTQVVLFFTDGDLTGKVGLNIDDGDGGTPAVRNADGANINFPNQEDEVGVNSNSTPSTAGNTTLPELVSVSKSPTLDLGGNATGGTTYSYAFDEDVDLVSAAGFFAYDANGTRYQATGCSNDAADATDHIIRCSAFNRLGPPATAATNPQLATFVLGTVDNGAVDEETGALVNVAEGAAIIS